MKVVLKVTILFFVMFLSSVVYAVPNAWLGTGYSSSFFRSPVTDGYMDLFAYVDNVTFTDLEFSVVYDSNTVLPITAGNLYSVRSGLAIDSVVTENLGGSLRKSTISLSGNITIGTVEYQSDAIFVVRFIPVAEGTMPVGLWESEWTRYPESYKNCSLSIENDGQAVDFERKAWNDDVILFTFTDKTSATLIYQYDSCFGNAITNGFLRVVYSDESVEDFYVSDDSRGITIATDFGGYFVTPLPDAVSYTLIFPEYYDSDLSLSGGYSISHSQPENFMMIKELSEGFHEGIPASANDITLTIEMPGIGVDFGSHEFEAAIAGETLGILDVNFVIDEVDANSVAVTIPNGLEADYYNMYLYKDGLILGYAWFSASDYFDVTFTIADEDSNSMGGVEVLIPKYGWQGLTFITKVTDANGQAVFQLPGNSEWGQYYDFYARYPGYENYESFVEVFDGNVEVPVTMSLAIGVDYIDYVDIASWWRDSDCSFYDNCNGFDYNYDGTVDFKDLEVFAQRWLAD